MNEDELFDALRARSERGARRSEEALWAEAEAKAAFPEMPDFVEESGDVADAELIELVPITAAPSRRSWYLAAAATVAAVVLGIGVLLPRLSTESELAVEDPDGASVLADAPDAEVEDPPTNQEELVESPTTGRQITVGIFDDELGAQIQELTPDRFTPESDISVTFVELEETDIGDLFSLALTPTENAVDVILLNSFEVSQFGANGLLQNLSPLVEADASYDLDDILPSIRAVNSVDGQLYGLPVSGESSFFMVNWRFLDNAIVSLPDEPTWEQIAALAAALDTEDVAGICLNSTAGWDELGASLTTVVNTFGGTWWEANADGTPGEPQINQADSGFRAATQFYVDLLQNFGPDEPAGNDSTDCSELLGSGEVSMWFGPTTAAGDLQELSFANSFDLGVAAAPVGPTGLPGGGLSSQSFAIPRESPNSEAAGEFIRWATSQEFIELVGERIFWSEVPSGTRLSTYETPGYQAATESFSQQALNEFLIADPNNPGTAARPGLAGVEYVGIPEFPDVANRCTAEIVLAIDGAQSVDDALDACQAIASEVSQQG